LKGNIVDLKGEKLQWDTEKQGLNDKIADLEGEKKCKSGCLIYTEMSSGPNDNSVNIDECKDYANSRSDRHWKGVHMFTMDSLPHGCLLTSDNEVYWHNLPNSTGECKNDWSCIQSLSKENKQEQWLTKESNWNDVKQGLETQYEDLKKWVIKDCQNEIPFEYYKTKEGKPIDIKEDECYKTRWEPFNYSTMEEINDNNYPSGCFLKYDRDVFFNKGGQNDCSVGPDNEEVGCLKKRLINSKTKGCLDITRNLDGYLGRQISDNDQCTYKDKLGDTGEGDLKGYDLETQEGKEKCAELVANYRNGNYKGISISTSGGGLCYGCSRMDIMDGGNNPKHSTYLLNYKL